MKSTIGANMTMIYWKGERFRLGTLQAREANLKDAHDMMIMEKVPAVTGVSPDFTVDLVDPESCRPAVRQSIERDGIDL